MTIFLKDNRKYYLTIILLGILAWYKVLDFWFLKGFEASWLMNSRPHTIVNLLRSHSFVYYIDWKIFGWNPWGWYLTSFIFHILASITVFHLILKITQKRLLAFITALIFVANTAYNDVLTWGSFNSYYPLLLTLILLSLIFFINYIINKKASHLLVSLVFALLACFVRETAIIIVPIITLYDILLSKEGEKGKIFSIIKRQIPYYLVIILFFTIRSLYGGIPGDFADSNVQMRVRFVADKLYADYAKAALLTFGKLIPPHVIPYPLLNSLRETLASSIQGVNIHRYFFSMLGFGVFAGIAWLTLFIKRSAKQKRLLLFFIGWIGLFLVFVGLAVPYTDEFLGRDYTFITMRYGYFAFVGTAVLIAILIHAICNKNKKIGLGILITYLLVQVAFIHQIEAEAYETTYREPKAFNTQFLKTFPTLSKNTVFYIFPHAVGLNDYLYEWHFTKDSNYPNLKDEPYRIESQIVAVQHKVLTKQVKLSDVMFLDFNKADGLIDKSKEIREALEKQNSYTPQIISEEAHIFSAPIENGPPVEIPYKVQFTIHPVNQTAFKGSSPNKEVFKALVDYSIDRNQFLKTARVVTANTMSQKAGEPFYHVLPTNLTDGNTGQRSIWIVDAIPAWIEVDLGEEKEIHAITWGSQEGSGREPSSYSYLISSDKANWDKIHEIKKSLVSHKIDVLPKPVRARYVRMEFQTTVSGNFVLLDEFEVISAQGKDILKLYDNRDKLFEDSRNIFNFASDYSDVLYAQNRGLDTLWGKLKWETNLGVNDNYRQEVFFPYSINGPSTISVNIPDAEIYSAQNQLFKRNIKNVLLEFNSLPFIIDVSSLQLLPQYPL